MSSTGQMFAWKGKESTNGKAKGNTRVTHVTAWRGELLKGPFPVLPLTG